MLCVMVAFDRTVVVVDASVDPLSILSVALASKSRLVTVASAPSVKVHVPLPPRVRSSPLLKSTPSVITLLPVLQSIATGAALAVFSVVSGKNVAFPITPNSRSKRFNDAAINFLRICSDIGDFKSFNYNTKQAS